MQAFSSVCLGAALCREIFDGYRLVMNSHHRRDVKERVLRLSLATFHIAIPVIAIISQEPRFIAAAVVQQAFKIYPIVYPIALGAIDKLILKFLFPNGVVPHHLAVPGGDFNVEPMIPLPCNDFNMRPRLSGQSQQ
jgi:hypothetical protein